MLQWRITPHAGGPLFRNGPTSVYRYLRRVLQVLTFLRGPNRWVIKCPQHMEQLVTLFRVFPDATLAITHRDPIRFDPVGARRSATSAAFRARSSGPTRSPRTGWIATSGC
jgi:hypothetical protein